MMAWHGWRGGGVDLGGGGGWWVVVVVVGGGGGGWWVVVVGGWHEKTERTSGGGCSNLAVRVDEHLLELPLASVVCTLPGVAVLK